MKKHSTWLLAAGTVVIGIWAGSSLTTVTSASSQLGSADDPVVTKSYVDQQIQKALGGTISSTDSKTNTNTSKNTLPPNSSTSNTSSSSADKNATNNTPAVPTTGNASSSLNGTGSSTSSNVNIVELRPGKKLIAEAGTQMIVRTGKAKVYSDGANGLIDITVGNELGSAQAAPNNHLLLFPREGRGVEVDSSLRYNATIMVIGNYKVL
ncbi:hypothetical protein [Paenibacillus dauci]|uniref:hypothetical protein n=1 Tax=Paenibacillus dauci TaxID=1567106 RepID=UPI0006196482|nr:hypothetical protein [Paenibacillus dauci]